MKKLLFLFAASVMLVTAISCSKDKEEPTPECEINNTTNIKVVNETGVDVTIDVWIKGEGFLGEEELSNNKNFTYEDAPATEAEFWIKPAGGYWEWSDEEYELTACELFTFTWSGKKLSEATPANKAARGIK